MSVVVAGDRIDPGPAPDPEADAARTATAQVLREIACGGLAGLIVGLVLAGIGGRLVMRLAALLVADAAGAVTENGNVIGEITVAGTAALVIFVGLLFGAVAGSVWVVISPWLPATTPARALVSIPIAAALGTAGLVDAGNRDFDILGHDPLVIASLVVLVALFGPALVGTERWLDRHLPRPGPTDRAIVAGYAAVTLVGVLLTVFIVMPLYLGSNLVAAGWALVVVGLATLGSWWLRVERERDPGPRLIAGARLALGVATVAGLWVTWIEVSGALAVA